MEIFDEDGEGTGNRLYLRCFTKNNQGTNILKAPCFAYHR